MAKIKYKKNIMCMMEKIVGSFSKAKPYPAIPMPQVHKKGPFLEAHVMPYRVSPNHVFMRGANFNYCLCTIYTKFDKLFIQPPLCSFFLFWSGEQTTFHNPHDPL